MEEKSFISGGGFSDVYVTMVKTAENSISTLVIEKDSEGLSFGGHEKKWVGILNLQPK